MEAEKFIYYTLVIFLIVGFAAGVGFSLYTQEEPTYIEVTDYSDRFDRIEAGIINSTVDFCFRWGGQWLSDQNGISVSDFEIPVGNGLFSKGQAIFCVKQKPEA